jgi:hypothetical protein
MTTLDRAFAFEQVHDAAVVIRQDLDFDMPRPVDEALDVQRAVSERRGRFATGLFDAGAERLLVSNRFHPDAAAARRRLQKNWESDAARRRCDRRRGLVCRRLTGNNRHASLTGKSTGSDFQAETFDDRGGRSDERDTRLLTRRSELRVLGKKSVAGMNGVGARRARRIQNCGN